jgi:hypothetical protein
MVFTGASSYFQWADLTQPQPTFLVHVLFLSDLNKKLLVGHSPTTEYLYKD